MINHWWTTRPKRKLITIVDTLRTFTAVAEGKPWRRNRALHLEFENALEREAIKRVGERRDRQGGGGRTYAAWLYSFGLWFDDSEGLARLTFAGEDLVKGRPPVPVMTRQILNFQYPSPFSHITRVHPRFRLFPFRFLLKLILHPRMKGELSQKEIARFVITKAETDADLDEVCQTIDSYRNSGDDSIFNGSFEAAFGELSRLEDAANTFINQLEYTQLIQRAEGTDRIRIAESQRRNVERITADQPALITRVDEPEYFQRKYGLGPYHDRDNRTFGRGPAVTAADTARRSILLALSDVLAYSPIANINRHLVSKISERTGVNEHEVECVISALGIQPSLDQFEEKYLQLAFGERAFAREFERATEGVFGAEGLGYKTKWVGSQPNNPDILAISVAEGDDYTGIIDAKAYAKYSVSGDHKRRMVHEYIPRYRKYSYGGRTLDLAFFSYVAGGFGRNIDVGIEKIKDESHIPGCAISAGELLRLLKQHRRTPFTKTEFKQLFTSNRQLFSSHFIRA